MLASWKRQHPVEWSLQWYPKETRERPHKNNYCFCVWRRSFGNSPGLCPRCVRSPAMVSNQMTKVCNWNQLKQHFRAQDTIQATFFGICARAVPDMSIVSRFHVMGIIFGWAILLKIDGQWRPKIGTEIWKNLGKNQDLKRTRRNIQNICLNWCPWTFNKIAFAWNGCKPLLKSEVQRSVKACRKKSVENEDVLRANTPNSQEKKPVSRAIANVTQDLLAQAQNKNRLSQNTSGLTRDTALNSDHLLDRRNSASEPDNRWLTQSRR